MPISRSISMRFFIGMILLLFAISCLWLPPRLFMLLIQLLSAGLAYEFSRAKFPNSPIILRMCAAVFSTTIVAIIYQEVHEFVLISLLGLMISISILLVITKKNTRKTNLIWVVFGILYTSILPAHLLLLKNLDHQFAFLLVLLITVVATDSGAYFIGSSIGRYKLWESLSPNKTWEGAFGGLLLGSTLVFLTIQITSAFDYSISETAIIAVLLSTSTIFGDLLASAIKRKMGIKDFSNILLDHGGFLDRVDSLIFTGMTFFWIQRLIS